MFNYTKLGVNVVIPFICIFTKKNAKYAILQCFKHTYYRLWFGKWLYTIYSGTIYSGINCYKLLYIVYKGVVGRAIK